MSMRCSRRPILLATLAAGLLFVMPSAAQAGGFSNPDFGVRRVGMFAVTARPDDVTAIFHNPAGLTLKDGTDFYHAQSWFVMDLGMRLYKSDGTLAPDKEIHPTLAVGAIPFLGFASDCGTKDFRLGFGIYAPNAYGAALPEDEATRYHAITALFLASRATLAAAYKINDMFRIGAAISLVHVYLTKTQYMNAKMIPADTDKFNDPKYDLRFKSRYDTAYDDMLLTMDGQDWTWAADLGILFHPIPSLRIGAAFSGGSDIELEGDVSLSYNYCRDANGKKIPNCRLGDPGSKQSLKKEKTTHHTNMVIPFELKAGFNWEFVKNFEVGMDVYYWHYQVFQQQRTVLKDKLFGLIKELNDQKNYGKSWAWNIGLMYRVVPSLELMCGFQMDFTPIPQQTYTLDNPSTDQKGISLGLRWQIDDRWRVGLAFVKNWFNLVNVQESVAKPPSNAKGHGSNNEFAFDFGYRF